MRRFLAFIFAVVFPGLIALFSINGPLQNDRYDQELGPSLYILITVVLSGMAFLVWLVGLGILHKGAAQQSEYDADNRFAGQVLKYAGLVALIPGIAIWFVGLMGTSDTHMDAAFWGYWLTLLGAMYHLLGRRIIAFERLANRVSDSSP